MTNFKEKIELYRKKECYCAEIEDSQTCSKCGQELPPKDEKCLICNVLDGLLKTTHKEQEKRNER